MAQRDEILRAHEVDIGQRAAGEGGKAEAEDRADIGLAHIGDDVILDRARGFHRLHHQEALLQFLDVERVGIEMLGLQSGKARPQPLLALAFLGIVVKALAVLAAEAALLFDHLDQQLLLRWIDRIGAEIGLGRLHDLQPRSSATSSDSDSGPTGMPAIFAVFSIIAGGTPSISMSMAFGG